MGHGTKQTVIWRRQDQGCMLGVVAIRFLPIPEYLPWLFSYSNYVTRRGILVVVVDSGFATLLTSQVISVAFYSERENYDKFCSEALILAWGSFTCRKSMTRDPGFISLLKEVILRIFMLWKTPLTPARFEPTNLGSSGEYDNHTMHVAQHYVTFSILL